MGGVGVREQKYYTKCARPQITNIREQNHMPSSAPVTHHHGKDSTAMVIGKEFVFKIEWKIASETTW